MPKSEDGYWLRPGMMVALTFGAAGIATMILTTPFVIPALRKHCLPYVPATDSQLTNLSKAIRLYSNRGENFLDIGSGDGRICRMASEQDIFSKVHGVELNPVLVFYSRALSLLAPSRKKPSYFRSDLWKFDLSVYDNISIFGVQSMMEPFREHLLRHNVGDQTIFACRFPIKGLQKIDEIGSGIDTVWIYRICRSGLNSKLIQP